MKEDLKIPITMLSISFLNKLPFIGSYCGKRFKFEKFSNEENPILKVYVWDDKLSFENTSKELFTIKDFEFSINGINEGIKFVESLIK